MRRIIYSIFLLAGCIASGFGAGKSAAQALPAPESTPAVRHACTEGLVFSDVLKNHAESFVAWHYSHSSHSSHSSHRSHYSSRF